MARLTDGNYYPQKVVIDYPKNLLTLTVSKQEVTLNEAIVVEQPKRVIKLDNPRKKLFIILVLIVLALFIYSDIVLLNEAFLTNGLLIVFWLCVGGAILSYYLRKEYSLTLRNDDGIYIIRLSEREKDEFNGYQEDRSLKR